jgi:hypothetical protein
MRSSIEYKFDNVAGEMQDACDNLGLYTHPNDLTRNENFQRLNDECGRARPWDEGK